MLISVPTPSPSAASSAIRLAAAPSLGEVRLEDVDVAAKFGGQRLQPVAAAGDERERLAAPGALPREFSAEARRRPGDERDGPGHRVSPSGWL